MWWVVLYRHPRTPAGGLLRACQLSIVSDQSPQELTVPGQDEPVTVEILSCPAGELQVHQVVAGLLSGQLPVEMVLVAPGPLAPDHLLGPLHPEVHRVTVTTRGASSKSGWRRGALLAGD